MTTQQGTAVDPTWTWGSSSTLLLSNATANNASAQLAQVSLPEPAVCSLYLQAKVRDIVNPEATRIGTFTVNLSQGLGRVTVPRQVSFSNQPSVNGPLEWTLPFVPLHALQVDVTATALFDSPESSIELQLYFVLSPLTRIPQKEQKLVFGMGLPGEADDIDDDLAGELEAEGPSVIESMREGRQDVDGSSPEERDDDAEREPQLDRGPAWLIPLIERMTRTLGRQPSVPELSRAVRRVRQRLARRAVR